MCNLGSMSTYQGEVRGEETSVIKADSGTVANICIHNFVLIYCGCIAIFEHGNGYECFE